MQVRPVSKTVIWLAVGMVLFAMLPTLTGFLDSKGQWFLPYGYSFDDQMVYQAWIHQAAEGNWRFSNRFTFDSDPGLTINLFFLVLGQIAKLAGGVGSDLLARGVGTALLVLALYRLIFRFSPNSSSRKSAMIFFCAGRWFWGTCVASLWPGCGAFLAARFSARHGFARGCLATRDIRVSFDAHDIVVCGEPCLGGDGVCFGD